MSSVGGLSPAEQHLGEALAALVDGELPHDARDRVLSHLATCPRCKAEADEQRRLKSVFSAAAPPAPSDGLLARLENLPGVDLDDAARRSPFAGGAGGGGVRTGGRAAGARAARTGGLGGRRDAGSRTGLTPAGAGAGADVGAGAGARRRSGGSVLDGGMLDGGGVLDGGVLDTGRGFRIHEVERPSAARGRRFAFAAAGAVSFAALALGGALPIEASVDPAGSPAVTPGDRGEPARYSYDPQLSTSGGAQDAGTVQPYSTHSGPLQLAASATAATTATPQPPLLSVVAVTKPSTSAPQTALSGMNTPPPR